MTKHRHPGHRRDPRRDPRTGEPVPGQSLDAPEDAAAPPADEPEAQATGEGEDQGGEGADAGDAGGGDTAGT